MSEQSEYWIEIAKYDIETAKAMLVSKRFFVCWFHVPSSDRENNKSILVFDKR